MLLVFPLAPAAAEHGKAARGAAATSEEAAVRAVIDAFFAAAQRRDWDTAADLMSDDFEIYTDGAAVFDKAQYHRLLSEDDLEVREMELRDVEVRVSPDGAMAWATYRGTFRGTSQGAAHDAETAETLIFARERGHWKIVRAHASVKLADAARAAN